MSNLNGKYVNGDLVIATRDFDACVDTEKGKYLSSKIKKGTVLKYIGTENKIYINNVATKVSNCYNFITYQDRCSWGERIDNIYTNQPNYFEPIKNLKKRGSNIYMLGGSCKIIDYISNKYQLYVQTDNRLFIPYKDCIFDKAIIDKQIKELNTNKPITIKKADHKLFLSGFLQYQHGVCADFQSEQDKRDEQQGALKIKQFREKYEKNGFKFTEEQMKALRNMCGFEKVNITIID